MNRVKIIRSTTVPQSLSVFCNGMLKELSNKYEVIGLSSPGKALDEVARREGVRTISIPMKRHISPFCDIVSLWRMIIAFWRERPYMVHSMTPKAGLICMISAWITRVPIRVHTFTGLVFPTASGIRRNLLKTTDWLTCACATHIIPEGEGVKNDLINHGITKKPLRVLGYGNVRGVDMEYYSRREEVDKRMNELGLRDDSLVTFLFVGRIVRDKGINELVAAFSKLLMEHSYIRLLLVGPYEDSLDPISMESRTVISNEPRIVSVGHKNGIDLLAYYESSDCFVLPSYREGFPNTVLEAGAMGLPSIVTDINGSREIIIDGVNGIIVPPHNVESLFSAMKLMVQSRVKRNAMASNARKLIGERFEQGFVHKCLYEFYDEIMPDSN